ncbi:MAG: tRNA (adenosine(37)-N6)-threonylcarbamoyltransferase complex ATPase subunit type 1 TsaE [Ruminococcus sp.]|nr:tRNA (adenosine(37)-N6)-threonylcarbamoyltransferase complex ATPase subunit type 1 TsaE [Ruminococcus sp.]
MIKLKTHSREETVSVGERLGRALKKGDMIAFRGGLGAGKTAFTTGLVLGLGLDRAEVSSPTFALVNEYRGDDISVFHFDMYRIVSEEGLESTGFFDYDFDNNVAVIEWSENIAGFLPKDAFIVTIEPVGENDREITIEGGGRDADDRYRYLR